MVLTYKLNNRSNPIWARRWHDLKLAIIRPSTKTTHAIVGFKERYETVDMVLCGKIIFLKNFFLFAHALSYRISIHTLIWHQVTTTNCHNQVQRSEDD